MLNELILTDGTCAFRKNTRCSGTFYRSLQLVAIGSIYVAAAQESRPDGKKRDKSSRAVRTSSLSLLSQSSPFFHSPFLSRKRKRERERIFSFRRLRSEVRPAQSVSWHVINQSRSRTCETRSATLARSPCARIQMRKHA